MKRARFLGVVLLAVSTRMTGADLASGLGVALDDEWRAAVIELTPRS